MAIFFHDEVLFGDNEGFSVWLNEHWQEHLQFSRTGLVQAVTTFIPDYDFGLWSWEPGRVASWLNSHQEVHNILRNFAGVGGVDLSVVDFHDESSWYEWHDSHSQEHSEIRTNLGLA